MLAEAFRSYISDWMGPEAALEGNTLAQTPEEKIKELYAFAYCLYQGRNNMRKPIPFFASWCFAAHPKQNIGKASEHVCRCSTNMKKQLTVISTHKC